MKKNNERLTQREKNILNNFFVLSGWEFSETLQKRCVLIAEYSIGGDLKASVYGLMGIRRSDDQEMICSYFIARDSWIYQKHSLERVLDFIQLLRKEYNLEFSDELKVA